MNIDDFLNDIQSDLDSQLSQFGLNNGQQNSASESEKKFCPECGTQVEIDANFCPSCGYSFNSETEDSVRGTQDKSSEQEGVIWTDTNILAKKYGTSRYPANLLLILDDFASNPLLQQKESELNRLLTKTRHYNISCIIAVQTTKFVIKNNIVVYYSFKGIKCC